MPNEVIEMSLVDHYVIFYHGCSTHTSFCPTLCTDIAMATGKHHSNTKSSNIGTNGYAQFTATSTIRALHLVIAAIWLLPYCQ